MATQFPPKSCQKRARGSGGGKGGRRQKNLFKTLRLHTRTHTHNQRHTHSVQCRHFVCKAAPPIALPVGLLRLPFSPACTCLQLQLLHCLTAQMTCMQRAACATCNVPHTHTKWSANGKWRNGRNSNKQSAPATPSSLTPPPHSPPLALPPLCLPPCHT